MLKSYNLIFGISLSVFFISNTANANKLFNCKHLKFNPCKKDSTTIKFNETNFNFGYVKAGYQAAHTFEFINTGKKKLKIIAIEPDCSCTIVEFDKNAINPSQKGKIEISLNTDGQFGDITKTIKVLTNAKQNLVKLTIKAKVINIGR